MRVFSLKHLDRLGPFDRSSNILICEKNSVYNVHSCCTFRLAILYLTDRSLDYFAHKIWLGIIHTTSYFVRNRTYVHDFLRVQFFSTKFLHTRLSVGGASLLENWILEGDEQGNFPVNAFEQCRDNVATLCCAKNCRCESSRVTSS